jgi:hypothetical protein
LDWIFACVGSSTWIGFLQVTGSVIFDPIFFFELRELDLLETVNFFIDVIKSA